MINKNNLAKCLYFILTPLFIAAVIGWRIPVKQEQEQKQQHSKIDSLLTEIDQLLNTGNASAAMNLLKDAETSITKSSTDSSYLKFLYLKGRAFLGISQFSDAEKNFDSLLKIARTVGADYWENIALGNLGTVHCYLGEYPQALAHYDSALAIARAIGDQKREETWLGNCAGVLLSLSEYNLAISYSDSALKIARKIGDRIGEAIHLGNLGNAYQYLGDFERAIQYYDSTLVIAKQIGDRTREQIQYGNLGIVYHCLGQFQRAITYYNSALHIAREIGDRFSEGRWLGQLGGIFRSIDNYPQAISYYDSSLHIARSLDDKEGVGVQLLEIGTVYEFWGNYQKSLAYYDSALYIIRQIGSRMNEKSVLVALGNVNQDLCHYDRALAYYDTALAIARDIDDPLSEGLIYGNLGGIYNIWGDYQRAIANFDSALHIAREIGDRPGEMRSLGLLGTSYFEVGQYLQAIKYYDSALVIAREIGDKDEMAAHLGNKGNSFAILDNFNLAISCLDSSLVISREIGDRQNEMVRLGNLGQTYRFLGNGSQAIAYTKNALTIARELSNRTEEGRRLFELATIYRLLGEYKLAIKYADSAHVVGKEITDAESIWRYDWFMGTIRSQMPGTKRTEVIDHFEKTIVAMETLSERLTEDSYKQSFIETQQVVYQDLINFLLLQNNPHEQKRALEIAEKARSRAFMELIARRFYGSAVDQKKELLSPANFQQIQETARRFDASILEYFISDTTLFIWIMQPDGQLHTVSAPLNPVYFDSLLTNCYLGFHQGQEKFRAIQIPDYLNRQVIPVIETQKKIDYQACMTKLYQTLFPAEIRAYLPKEKGAKLVLVPHRKLSIIPMMALMDSSGNYLIAKYCCCQVPSVGILLRTKEILENRERNKKVQANEMLFLGNPEMPIWANHILPPLNGAENEVKTIAKKLQTNFQIGAAASEHHFKNFSSQMRLIHLATHGIAFDASPLESFVALAPGKGEDGQLTAAEILQMKFNADLVVLSACETGLGKISGDGVEGLLRSFMVSGVPSVLVSLWQVDDEATKELMLSFYENLFSGLDNAESLRQAQLKLLRSKKWSDPKYWAAFVLYGER